MKNKYFKSLLGILSVFSLGYLYFLYLVSLFKVYKPPEQEILDVKTNSKQIPEQKEFTLLSWNIGYAGLGVNADFSLHGGKYLLPQSKERVEGNLNSIVEFLASHDFDYYLLQEIAGKIKITHDTDILNCIRTALASYNVVFSKSLDIKHFPLFGSLLFGNIIFSKYLSVNNKAERISLPLETKGLTGIFNQKFHMLKYETPLKDNDKKLVVINLHLSAFDEDGAVRKQQLSLVKEVLEQEHQNGNYVIAGGDWNHILTHTEFPYLDSYPKYTKKKDYMDWLVKLPEDFAPTGWQWGVDHDVPSLRSLEKPYVKGENYTSIIDGFLVSPNIEILEVKGFEQGFEHSDHQPVSIKIKLN